MTLVGTYVCAVTNYSNVGISMFGKNEVICASTGINATFDIFMLLCALSVLIILCPPLLKQKTKHKYNNYNLIGVSFNTCNFVHYHTLAS